MKFKNYLKQIIILSLLPALTGIAMEPQKPPQPVHDIRRVFADIQQMRNERRLSENYLAQLPPELREQIIPIIDQELFGPLPPQVQNYIRNFLNGRVWVDLDRSEKLKLIDFIITQYPYSLTKDWQLLSTISYVLSLKDNDFNALANSKNAIHAIITRLEQNTNLDKWDIAAGLNTPVSIQWLKRELLRAEGPDRIITDHLIDLFTFLFQKRYYPTFTQMIKTYITIASNMRLNFDFNVKFGQERMGTLLTNAIKNNVPYEIIKLLIANGADVNKRTGMGTPLAIAQQTAGLDARVIPLLLAHGAAIEGNPAQEPSAVEAEEEY